MMWVGLSVVVNLLSFLCGQYVKCKATGFSFVVVDALYYIEALTEFTKRLFNL